MTEESKIQLRIETSDFSEGFTADLLDKAKASALAVRELDADGSLTDGHEHYEYNLRCLGQTYLAWLRELNAGCRQLNAN